MKIRLRKIDGNLLAPADDESAEFALRLKLGQVIHADFKRMRNYEFHKKFFSLLNYSFGVWEPECAELPNYPGVIPEKNFKQFREDITIMAGYYDVFIRLNGESRTVAKSISFGSMKEDDFEKLYSATIDVILKHVLVNYDKEELERVLIEVMSFT